MLSSYFQQSDRYILHRHYSRDAGEMCRSAMELQKNKVSIEFEILWQIVNGMASKSFMCSKQVLLL